MAYINEMSGLTALKNMYSSEIGRFPVVRKWYCYTTAQYRYIHCALKIGRQQIHIQRRNIVLFCLWNTNEANWDT